MKERERLRERLRRINYKQLLAKARSIREREREIRVDRIDIDIVY